MTSRPALATSQPADRITRDPDFVKLWAGETVSLIGTQVTQFALPLVAILTLRASVLQVGLLAACRYAPVVLISLFAGVWLDRRRRRPVLIACSLGNAVLVGTVPIASALGWLSMNLLYAICILVGVLTVVFDVGVLSYVPTLVGRRNLAESNSRIQSSTSLAMVAGPGLAGILVGILTAPITLSLDAVSYLFSAAGLLGIRRPEPAPELPEVRPTVRRSIIEGLQAVYGSPVLRSLLNQSAAFNFVQSGFITIFVVYAVRDLRLSPFKLGVVLGAIAVGALGGAAFANRITKAFGVGRTMRVGITAGTLCQLVVLVPRGSGAATMVLLCATEILYGFGVLMFRVNSITIVQTVTPNRLLGRMNASYRLVLFGTAPLGAVLVGVLGQSLGTRSALVVTVIAFTTPIAWTVFSPVFRLTEMPPGPAEDAVRAPADPDQNTVRVPADPALLSDELDR